MIDQVITLKALDHAVFNDDKEGVLGMRVAHWLESPDEKGGVFIDANGRPTKVDSADTSGATGVYLTSEGVKGGAVWSTRGKWCSLTGHTGDHTVTIAILDHPKNPGLSDVLACAWLWTLCGESAGAQHLRSQAAGIQFHDGERSDCHISLSRRSAFGRSGSGRME